MIKKLILILLLTFLYADNAADDTAKLVYIKQEVLKDTNSLNYIGEIIGVKYDVIVLDNASISSINFLGQKGVELKNPDSSWTQLDDGTLENTFYFKIEASNFSIPALEVIVANNNTKDSATSQSINNQAIDLRLNHPNFTGVVANNFEIRNYAIKKYDENNNILLLNLFADTANLEDFKLRDIAKQGFKSFNYNNNQSNGIFYAIFPNLSPNIEFEYFDLKTQTYKSMHINNIINQEEIDTNQDISPINKVFIFNNILILMIIFIMLIAFFIRKFPFKLRLSMLIIAIILILYLVISINDDKSGVLKTDSLITILPIPNSTIIAKIPINTKVKIVSKYNDYYKIITNDDKTGWIKKDNVK